MNTVINRVVIADPKAIVARRGSAKIVQNVGMRSEKTDAKQWRREHGLETQGPAKMKKNAGFTIIEFVAVLFYIVIVLILGCVIAHFIIKFW